MDLLRILLISATSYVIGSVLTGEIVARLKKVNLRNEGSGNVGATNVFRSMGSFYGAIVLVSDALKGVIAVLIGNAVGTVFGIDLSVLAGIMAIVGHNWSIFARFKGGKGIATSLGVIIALTPKSLLVVLPVWLVLFFLFGYVSLASIVAAISYPVSAIFLYPGNFYKTGLAVILAVFAVYRHRENIHRLLRGEENRILYNHHKRSTEKK